MNTIRTELIKSKLDALYMAQEKIAEIISGYQYMLEHDATDTVQEPTDQANTAVNPLAGQEGSKNI